MTNAWAGRNTPAIDKLTAAAGSRLRTASDEMVELLAPVAGNPNGEPEGPENLADAVRLGFAQFGGIELDEHPAELVRDPTDLALDATR